MSYVALTRQFVALLHHPIFSITSTATRATIAMAKVTCNLVCASPYFFSANIAFFCRHFFNHLMLTTMLSFMQGQCHKCEFQFVFILPRCLMTCSIGLLQFRQKYFFGILTMLFSFMGMKTVFAFFCRHFFSHSLLDKFFLKAFFFVQQK